MSLKRVPPQSQADGQELTVLGVELALEPGPSPHLCKPYTWAGGQRGRCLWVSSSGPMASLELNGSVSPVMKGALSPLPGTVHQDEMIGLLHKQLLLKLPALKGKERAGATGTVCFSLGCAESEAWVEFITASIWFILRMNKYTSSTYLNGKE